MTGHRERMKAASAAGSGFNSRRSHTPEIWLPEGLSKMEAVMKAFSTIYPYSQVLRAGVKLIETRGTATNYKGPLYICESKTAPLPEWLDDENLMQYAGSRMPGMAVAACRIVDCVLMDDEFINNLPDKEKALGIYRPGRYAWILEDVQPVEPFPVRGKLGVYEI